jgi:hypothetical protein
MPKLTNTEINQLLERNARLSSYHEREYTVIPRLVDHIREVEAERDAARRALIENAIDAGFETINQKEAP